MKVGEHQAAGLRGGLGVVEWIRPDEASRVPQIVEQMRTAGITRLRTGVSWADWHTEDGRDWYGWLIPEIARHVELLPCVHYTPPSLGMLEKSSAPPRDPKSYADFLDVLVSDLGAHFDWIELWNEPTNLLDWDWRLDPDWKIFCEMAGGAAYWMQRRGKRVVLGGNCPTDLNWLRHVAENGVLDYVDAVGVHGFPGSWSADWAGWSEELGALRRCLDGVGRPRPLWITEAGYSTWRHDEAAQLRELHAVLQSDADRIYWYALQDLAPEVATQQGFHVDERHYHFGLYRADGAPKLAARCLTPDGRRLAAVVERPAPRIRAAVPRIVVTGGAGFLGSNLVDRLAAEGHDVLIVDSLGRDRVEENLDWVMSRHRRLVNAEVADVRDAFAMRDVIKEASAVIHLAAQVAVTTSVADPQGDFAVNAQGTLNVLEAVRRGAPNAPVLFASTNKVYGELFPRSEMVRVDNRYLPRDWRWRPGLDEATPLSFHSPYGCSKGVADQYVLDYARVFGLNTAVLRMSCLYGPRQFGTEDQGWVAHFLISALNGLPITVYGDGYQLRDVLYVEDAVEAYLRALRSVDRISGRAFNLGGGAGCTLSLRELLALIPSLTGVAPEVSFAPWRPGDQAWYVSDTSALTDATGWCASVGVQDGLRQLVAWLRTAACAPIEGALVEDAKERLA